MLFARRLSKGDGKAAPNREGNRPYAPVPIKGSQRYGSAWRGYGARHYRYINQTGYDNSPKAQRLPRQHQLLHRGSGFESVRAREDTALISSGNVGRLLSRDLGRFEGQSLISEGSIGRRIEERGRRGKA